jgi:hypothetical protein
MTLSSSISSISSSNSRILPIKWVISSNQHIITNNRSSSNMSSSSSSSSSYLTTPFPLINYISHFYPTHHHRLRITPLHHLLPPPPLPSQLPCDCHRHLFHLTLITHGCMTFTPQCLPPTTVISIQVCEPRLMLCFGATCYQSHDAAARRLTPSASSDLPPRDSLLPQSSPSRRDNVSFSPGGGMFSAGGVALL